MTGDPRSNIGLQKNCVSLTRRTRTQTAHFQDMKVETFNYRYTSGCRIHRVTLCVGRKVHVEYERNEWSAPCYKNFRPCDGTCRRMQTIGFAPRRARRARHTLLKLVRAFLEGRLALPEHERLV